MSTTLDPVRIGHFSFPARKQRLPDGQWVVTPGEPQMRCRTADAVRITGIPSKTLHKLADAGVIRRAMVTPNIVFWWPAEIEAVIERAASDEGFSRKICYAADCRSSDLRG
jgi:hypothetical protein